MATQILGRVVKSLPPDPGLAPSGVPSNTDSLALGAQDRAPWPDQKDFSGTTPWQPGLNGPSSAQSPFRESLFCWLGESGGTRGSQSLGGAVREMVEKGASEGSGRARRGEGQKEAHEGLEGGRARNPETHSNHVLGQGRRRQEESSGVPERQRERGVATVLNAVSDKSPLAKFPKAPLCFRVGRGL